MDIVTSSHSSLIVENLLLGRIEDSSPKRKYKGPTLVQKLRRIEFLFLHTHGSVVLASSGDHEVHVTFLCP